MGKYKVPRPAKKSITIAIDPKLHELVKIYAYRNKLTIREATEKLYKIGLTQEEGIDLTNSQ